MDSVKPSEITIVTVDWSTHERVLRALRTQVFVEEQGVSGEDEWDDWDTDAQHFLAIDSSDAAIGTARLLPSGKLTRMAVVPAWRSRGVGRQILAHVMEVATAQGMEQLYLDAQIQAHIFYERYGFIAEGEPFIDAGIPHIRMRRSLADPLLTSDVVRFTERSQVQESLRTFTLRGRNSLDVLTDSLSPQLYSERALVEQISRLARRSPRSRVRILVRDSRPLRGVEHGLIELARRLPSRVSIRRVVENTPPPNFSFYCVDGAHLVYFSNELEFSGFARYSARAESRRRLAEFEHWWQYASEADPDLGSIIV